MRRLALVALLASCAARNEKSVALYDTGDYAGAARSADDGLAGHPDDEGLWQMKIRAALALGDGDAVAKAYASYASTRGELDRELIRELAVATLEQALGQASPAIKVAAIDAIAASELHALADAVARRLEDDSDLVAASAAAAVLRGFPQAPEVADRMTRSKDPAARRIAFDAIGKKAGKIALGELEKAASDPDAGVRRTAIRWLGQLKDTDAHELLVKRQRDPDEGVRAAAAIALGRIGIGNLAELAKRAVDDRALAVRLAGIELYRIARRDDELAKLADDKHPMVALAAAIELKATRPALAPPALAKALAAEDWTFRAGGINEAIRAVGKDAARAAAKPLAADAELGVRLAVARVLAATGDRDGAIAILVAMLDGARGIAAAADLAELGDARGTAALGGDVRNAKRGPAERAEAAAAHRGAHVVTAGLVAALADPNAEVRVTAAATLAALAK